MAMTLHCTVMVPDPENWDDRTEQYAFIPEPEDDNSDLYESFILDADVWQRMGKPNKITVTVEVGDVKNAPDVQDSIGGSPVEH